MHMEFFNSYQDARRAGVYAKLEFPVTYYLAYRDLPESYANMPKGEEHLILDAELDVPRVFCGGLDSTLSALTFQRTC